MKNTKILVALILLLCCTLLLPASAQEEIALERYQTMIPNDDPARPYVELRPYANPVYQMHFADRDVMGWHFGFVIQEANGVPFTLTAMSEICFDAQGQITEQDRTEKLDFFETTRLADGQSLEFMMRLDGPSNVRWIAYEVEGMDDAGNTSRFHCLFELLPEEKPVQKVADFMEKQQPEAGRPFVKVSAEPEMVYASAEEDGQFWWLYQLVFENTGDDALNVLTFNEVYFNGENVMVDGLYQAADVITWCDEEDTVLEAGERWVIEVGMPVQEMTTGCLRLTGEDGQGEEMSFTGMFELRHEMKNE